MAAFDDAGAWWQLILAACLAPAAVWALWRVQSIVVEGLRRSLVGIESRFKPVYWFVSWFATLLHELSHAVVFLLSGHGIKQFRAGVEEGHVTPRRGRVGVVGFFGFALAALAPLYIPAAIILGLVAWLLRPDVVPFAVGPDDGLGLDAAAEVARAFAVDFPLRFASALAHLDLATWSGALLFTLILVAMPGSRPSFVKGSRFHGEEDQGDIAVLRSRIKAHKALFALFLASLVALYFALVPFFPAVYWFAFEAVWAVALAGTVLSLAGAVLWLLVTRLGQARLWVAWVPVAVAVLVQWAGRVYGIPGLEDAMPPTVAINLATGVVFAAACIALPWLVPAGRSRARRRVKA